MKKENKAKEKSDLHALAKNYANIKIFFELNYGIGDFYEFVMSKTHL